MDYINSVHFCEIPCSKLIGILDEVSCVYSKRSSSDTLLIQKKLQHTNIGQKISLSHITYCKSDVQ